ncbi:MAG: HAMP domain-containing sensor histidine kinase [Myxococcota bacterium]
MTEAREAYTTVFRASARRQDAAFFALIVLTPALTMGWLATVAVRGEEAAVRREMTRARDGMVAQLRSDTERAFENLGPEAPFAEPVTVDGGSGSLGPPSIPCAPVAEPWLDASPAKLDGDTRDAIVRRCFHLRTKGGRHVWPLLALAPGADTPADLIRAWVDEVGGDLAPAERAATLLDLDQAAWLGAARGELTSMLKRRRSSRSMGTYLAPRRTSIQARRPEIRWSDAVSRGVLRHEGDGRYRGFVVHAGSVARALEKGWPRLPEDMRARLAAGPAGSDPTAVPLLDGGLSLHLDWVDPNALASKAASARRLVLGGTVGAMVMLLCLSSWLFVRVRRERRLAALRTDFVAAVSHELRTPIASVRMLSELLHEDRVTVEERPAITTGLTREAKRLGDTVDRLLRFSRFEAGHADPAPRVESEVAPVLAETVARFSERHPHRRVEVARTDVARWPLIPDAVAMAVDNLLENAHKYAPTGEPYRIEASVRRGMLRVSVSDRGPGIARADRRRIFRAFERADDRLSAATDGTGIGLSLVQQVARVHGGHVELESELDRGATFTLVFPP